MQNITFVILHHSTHDIHSNLLAMSVASIRAIYPANRIIVCKTSTSTINENIIKTHRLEVENTVCDGTTVYGGICCIIKHRLENYILLHDSMILLKALPLNILEKDFYYLWYFTGHRENHTHTILKHLQNADVDNFTTTMILDMYNEYRDWKGCFGPAFGGNYQTLQNIYNFLKLDKTISNYIGRDNLLCAERFIAVLSVYLKILHKDISMNGNIFGQPLNFSTKAQNMSIEEIVNLNYSGYFFKIWVGRP